MSAGEILSDVARDSHRRPNPFEHLRTRTVIPWVIVASIALVAVFFVLALLTPLDASDPQTFEVMVGFALYGALASWVVWACHRSGIGLRRLVGTLPDGYNWLSWVRLAGLLAVTMLFSYGSALVLFYGLATVAPGVLEFLIEAVAAGPDPRIGHRLALAAEVVILAPILEEALFRGIFVNRWGYRWGVPTALAVSSIAFGVLHANPVGIGVAGLVAALLYLRTRTLIVPIVFHAANNLVPTLAEWLDPSGPLDIAAEIQAVRDDVLIGVALVAVSLPILARYIRRHWPGRDAALPYRDADRVCGNSLESEQR